VSASVESDATISDCGLYRYSLSRRWGPGRLVAAFVMLNPSTADASKDDPTIRRCVGFARSWGYDGIEVVNLFALRSPNPEDLIDSMEAGVDPVGPENDRIIDFVAGRSAKLIAAWGAHPFAKTRAQKFLDIRGVGSIVECLGVTKDGSPRHPLYVRADQELMRFDPRRSGGAA